MTGLTEALQQRQRKALERMMLHQKVKEERKIVKALQIKISTGYLYKGRIQKRTGSGVRMKNDLIRSVGSYCMSWSLILPLFVLGCRS